MQYNGNEFLVVGNGSQLKINHVGKVDLPYVDAKASLLSLNHVLHVPKITKNLMSISKLTADNKVYVEFHSTFCLVKDKKNRENADARQA